MRRTPEGPGQSFLILFLWVGVDEIEECSECKPIEYPTPQPPLSTDLLTALALTATNHTENQPVHLQLPYMGVENFDSEAVSLTSWTMGRCVLTSDRLRKRGTSMSRRTWMSMRAYLDELVRRACMSM